MLYTETITPAALELLTVLMQDEVFKAFILVGGTALTLQIDHRLSIDLDLFTDIDFDEPIHLRHNKNFSWNAIERQLYNMINTPDSIFPQFE